VMKAQREGFVQAVCGRQCGRKVARERCAAAGRASRGGVPRAVRAVMRRIGGDVRAAMRMTATDGAADARAAGAEDLEAKTLPSRQSVHLARKIFHFVTGYLIALCNHVLVPSHTRFGLGMLACAAFVMSVEVLRLRFAALNKVVQTLFRPFMRAHETRKFSGMAYYLSGVAVASLLCDKQATIIGILLLASADPVASLFGVLTKSHSWAQLPHGKSLIGFFAGGLAALFVLFRLALAAASPAAGVDSALFLQRAAVVALCTAVAEFAVPSPQLTLRSASFPLGLDDNFVLPVIAAVSAQLALAPVALSSVQLSRFLLW